MADSKNSDPVLRQSTRLTCMAVTGAQSSYDPRVIKKWVGESAANHPALVYPQRTALTAQMQHQLQLFIGNHSTTTAVSMIEDQVPDNVFKDEILKFIKDSKTGIIKRYSKIGIDEDQTY